MEDKFDGFTVNLYLDEDGDWTAHFLELPNIAVPARLLCSFRVS
jgi:hypothetical protein